MRKKILSATIFLLIASLQLTHAQTPLLGRDSTVTGTQTFALIMGISKYQHVRPLSFADKDAEMFRDYLKSPGGGSVKDGNIYCLLNEQASSINFWTKGFQWLKSKKLQKGDKLFIYLAGHGDAIDEDQFFFLSYDCNPQGDKNNYLVAGTIQLFNLKKKIADETGKGVEVVFVMDACRTNELPGGQEGQSFLNSAVSEAKAGEIIMLAAAAGEESLEDASIGNGHGLFTWYLVNGLTGVADSITTPDNQVTLEEIQKYVSKNVPAVAQQQFRRKQDPFFCCNEQSDKVISKVNTSYLQQWLNDQKKSKRGPGNSFEGVMTYRQRRNINADTSLIESYNLFNRAISSNRISGNNSAEYYFQQMSKRFPGTPYTLDAKSSLAVEFISAAQKKVDRFLACGDNLSAKEKQENYQAAIKLQQAIELVREDDPLYAQSLMNRVYFLKASGDFGPNGTNGNTSDAFSNAFAALRIDRNGAYIHARLAQLHLQNNNLDSAYYYADKATKIAPKWPCAFTILAQIKKQQQQKNPDNSNTKKPKLPGKNSIGFTIGGGFAHDVPVFVRDANSPFLGVTGNNNPAFDLGIIYQAGVGGMVDIRPTVQVVFDGGDLVYERPPTSGVQFETIKLENISVNAYVPLIFRLSKNRIAPFVMLGPGFNFILSQDKNSRTNIPVKRGVVLGDLGLGVDIGIKKAGIILSPEIKYTRGLTNQYRDGGTIYTNALSSLKKQGFTFHLYIRKK